MDVGRAARGSQTIAQSAARHRHRIAITGTRLIFPAEGGGSRGGAGSCRFRREGPGGLGPAGPSGVAVHNSRGWIRFGPCCSGDRRPNSTLDLHFHALGRGESHLLPCPSTLFFFPVLWDTLSPTQFPVLPANDWLFPRP